MDRFNATQIDAVELAERLKEDLKDFHNSGMIQSMDLREKSSYVNLLRAINHADRVVCRDTQVDKLVVVYAPAGTTNIPFYKNDQYTAEIETAIDGLNLSDVNESVFIDNYSYMYVSEINDRYIYVYDKYPIGGELSERRLKKVGHAEFYSSVEVPEKTIARRYITPNVENLCHYSVNEARLILGETFDTSQFLRFNARIFPGILNIKDIPKDKLKGCDYNVYQVAAPHFAFELVLAEALMYLLPRGASDARVMVDRDRQREDWRYQKMKPTDRNVVVPDHSF